MKNDSFAVYEDLYNMFCGDLIGEGVHRMVFDCKVRPDLVVKVERSDFRYFANVFEMQFWSEYSGDESIGKWLAPCEFLSPDGRILLQKRCDPLPLNFEFPEMMPSFLCDFKRGNYGLLDGNLVCVDYAMYCVKPSKRLKRVNWA